MISTTTRIYGYLSRWLGVAGYMIQYGCIAHCTLEFVGDFVVVRLRIFCFQICNDLIL